MNPNWVFCYGYRSHTCANVKNILRFYYMNAFLYMSKKVVIVSICLLLVLVMGCSLLSRKVVNEKKQDEVFHSYIVVTVALGPENISKYSRDSDAVS